VGDHRAAFIVTDQARPHLVPTAHCTSTWHARIVSRSATAPTPGLKARVPVPVTFPCYPPTHRRRTHQRSTCPLPTIDIARLFQGSLFLPTPLSPVNALRLLGFRARRRVYGKTVAVFAGRSDGTPVTFPCTPLDMPTPGFPCASPARGSAAKSLTSLYYARCYRCLCDSV
jgi:hypothetical protein